MGSKVAVTITRYHGHCEDCGHYDGGFVVVLHDGIEVCREGWNGHLGGSIGGPEHDLPEFLSAVLRSVGVNATVTEECD